VSDLEKVRRGFRPRHITTLFVGESPPHGGAFFYNRDSRLYRRVKEAFGNDENFLSEFKAKGFFLDDLVLYPINQIKEKKERNEHRRKGVPMLASRMKDYQPAAVVALMLEIEPMVIDAMDQAGLSSVPRYVTHFPIFPKNVKAFKEEMAEIIPKLPVNGSHP
jgi:hypothetical protein